MKIAVIMGSNSDYTTMIETCKLLENAKFLEFVQTQQKLQFLIEDLNKVMYKPLDELFEKYGNK